MDILGQLNADCMTIMLVTHDARIAARASRIIYLVDGRIVSDRRQPTYDGTGLDQRHTDVTTWLLEQEHRRERSRSTLPDVPA